MEFYDNLLKEYYSYDFLKEQFDKYVQDYNILGLKYLFDCLAIYLYIDRK